MPLREIDYSDDRALQDIADLLVKSHRQIVITGAGISTSCGIPDFRSKDGLYNLTPQRVSLPTPPPSNPSTPASRKRKRDVYADEDEPPSSQSSIFSSSAYKSSPTSRMRGQDLFHARVFQAADSTTAFYQFIATLRSKIYDEVRDTSATHKFIRTLRDGGRLMRCYTQNIDGLEAREGMCMDLTRGKGNKRRFMKKNYELPRPKVTEKTEFDGGCEVVQLHGELSMLRCRVCSAEQEWTEEATGIFLEGAAPKCELCEEKSTIRQIGGKRGLAVGELRPNIVLYGEEHPQNSLLTPLIPFDLSSNPDVMIIMGTSLKVHGLQKIVRDFAKVIHSQKGGRVIFVNRTRPAESQWEGVIDDYVAMDCDDWVDDLKKRREELWLHQGSLELKQTKVTGEKKKRKSTENDESNLRATKKTKSKSTFSVDLPPLRKTQSKAQRTPPTPKSTSQAKDKRTPWTSKSQPPPALGQLFSPSSRPVFSPLSSRHHGTRWRKSQSEITFHTDPTDNAGEAPTSATPSAPSFSPLSTHTTRAQARYATNITTPTPHKKLRSTLSRQTLTPGSDSCSSGTSPPASFRTAIEHTDEIADTDDEADENSEPKKLSLVDGSVDGEEKNPLYAPRPKSFLTRMLGIVERAAVRGPAKERTGLSG